MSAANVDKGTSPIQVLLIEPDKHDLEVTRGLLKEAKGCNFDIAWADSPAAGILKLQNQEFDVVLMELLLANAPGLDAFLAVSAMAPGIPIVVFTSLGNEALGIETVKIGAQDCLIKGEVDGRSLAASLNYAIERKKITNSLRLQCLSASILAEAQGACEFLRRIVQEVCSVLSWNCGIVWQANQSSNTLRCVEFWQRPALGLPELESACREHTFEPGSGLPGKVWQTGAPLWIANMDQEQTFLPIPALPAEGFRSAVGFPIVFAGQIVGVMEFFSQHLREPDQQMILMFAALGSQLGQFLEHQRIQQDLCSERDILRSILDNLVEGVVVANVQGKLLMFNAAAERLVGIGLLDTQPQEWPEAYGVYYGDCQTLYAWEELPLVRAINGQEVKNEQIFLKNPERPEGIWLSCNARPLRDEEGRLIGGVVITCDVSERKRADEVRSELSSMVLLSQDAPLSEKIRNLALRLDCTP